jgi:hypothetical protein
MSLQHFFRYGLDDIDISDACFFGDANYPVTDWRYYVPQVIRDEWHYPQVDREKRILIALTAHHAMSLATINQKPKLSISYIAKNIGDNITCYITKGKVSGPYILATEWYQFDYGEWFKYEREKGAHLSFHRHRFTLENGTAEIDFIGINS